jgi:hypothetical protein
MHVFRVNSSAMRGLEILGWERDLKGVEEAIHLPHDS